MSRIISSFYLRPFEMPQTSQSIDLLISLLHAHSGGEGVGQAVAAGSLSFPGVDAADQGELLLPQHFRATLPAAIGRYVHSCVVLYCIVVDYARSHLFLINTSHVG
jgi:hypothetical protein